MPKKVLKPLSSVLIIFFGKGRIRVAWEKVRLPKQEGGLGLTRVTLIMQSLQSVN